MVGTFVNFAGFSRKHVCIQVSVSGPNLRHCIANRAENIQMIPSPDVNMVNREQRCYLQHNFCRPMLWAELQAKRCHLRLHGAFVPLSVIHLLLGETLQQACHQAHWHQSVLHVAVWHNTAGVALWPGGKSGSIAVAALAFITAHTNSLQLTVWWCWQRDPGLHLKHIVSRCGGGDARRWKMLFTDGPLKKPTAAKQCSRWAVWGVEAIMGCDCLARGHW